MDRVKNNPRIGFTENSGHGLGSVKGSLDSQNESGMDAQVVVIPNMGKEVNAPKEFPSQNA